MLGIITMRFVVRYFLILLERFPGLEEGAYYLVAWIGLKLLISGFHQGRYLGFHIPERLFWVVMLLIAGVSLVVKPRARPRSRPSWRRAWTCSIANGENSWRKASATSRQERTRRATRS